MKERNFCRKAKREERGNGASGAKGGGKHAWKLRGSARMPGGVKGTEKRVELVRGRLFDGKWRPREKNAEPPTFGEKPSLYTETSRCQCPSHAGTRGAHPGRRGVVGAPGEGGGKERPGRVKGGEKPARGGETRFDGGGQEGKT